MITADLDTTVSTKAIQDFYNMSLQANPKNRILNLNGCDHSNILFDDPLVSLFVRKTIEFFN